MMSIKTWIIITCIVVSTLITLCTVDFYKDKQRYNDVVKDNTIESCDTYLSMPYSEVMRKNHVRAVLRLKEDIVWQETNTTRDYADYLAKYPSGRYISEAKELQEDDCWRQVKDINTCDNYLKKYPQGRYCDEAKRLQEYYCWQEAQNSNSYENYLAKYPIGRYSSEAKSILEQEKWKTDALAWSEATNRNTIEAYKKYLNLYPKGKNAQQAEKIIIDKEVDEIFSTDYGMLPPMDKISSGNGSHTKISIHNSTSYTLTVRYSGAESKSFDIQANKTHNISLRNGFYRVTASVNTSRVRNYAGTETLTGGSYDVEYYINHRKTTLY